MAFMEENSMKFGSFKAKDLLFMLAEGQFDALVGMMAPELVRFILSFVSLMLRINTSCA